MTTSNDNREHASMFMPSDANGFIHEPGCIPFHEGCWDWHEPNDPCSITSKEN